MKKTKLLLASLFFVLLGIAFSCKVDIEAIDDSSKKEYILSRAKKSFEERIKNDPILKKYNIEPVWSAAVASENSFEVPFTIDGKYRVPYMKGNETQRGRERLLVIEKGSKFTFRIIRYIPSKWFKGDIKTINTQNLNSSHFFGTVSTIVLGKKQITICSFSDGRMYKKKYGVPKGNKKGRMAEQSCSWEYIEPYVTLGWDGHEVVFIYHDGQTVYVCVDIPDDSDPDICEINPSICDPCAGNRGSRVADCDPCLANPASCGPCQMDPSCNGGGDIDNDGIADIILDQIKNKPCYYDRVKEVINNSSSNEVNQIVKNYTGNDDPRVRFKFQDEGIDVDAGTQVFNTVSIIALNPIGLEKADRAYLIATIYHEFIHVYLPGDNNADHTQMLIPDANGKTWVDKLAEIISEVSGVSLVDANAMAAFGVRPLTAAEETLNNNHKFSNPNTNNNNGNCN
jgi:hypothetical protein